MERSMNTAPYSDSPEESSGKVANATATPEAEVLQAEHTALNDRYLRLAADFDNFRKRTIRDSEQRAAAQKDAFILELLPVVDNLERAIATHQSTSAEQLLRGIEMTLQQLRALLHRHGVESEESLGAIFDPHRHEAINARFAPDQPDHAIVDVVQRGYRRGSEIIRPAKVIINNLSLGLTDHEGDSNGG
jgi:molecular chaperone GrpE